MSPVDAAIICACAFRPISSAADLGAHLHWRAWLRSRGSSPVWLDEVIAAGERLIGVLA